MRLLLDEYFSPAIARLLRDRGHDVIAVRERPDLTGRSDRVHFASAADQRRAIVTQDIGDFRPLLAEVMRTSRATYGLVCVPSRFPLTRAAIGSAVEALHALLLEYLGDDDLANAGGEVWLQLGDSSDLTPDNGLTMALLDAGSNSATLLALRFAPLVLRSLGYATNPTVRRAEHHGQAQGQPLRAAT